MKFGDKLILLRKKNGLSQEELAEKLGVSRQSVSKWESNNTYPETDKIIQICNLFECSMDDLINDKVTDIELTMRKNKNNLNEVWDSLLDFITRSINMFAHMKFSNGLKCIIEMMIVAFIMYLLGLMVCNVSSGVIANVFNFLGNGISEIIKNVLKNIFYVFWFVLAVIVIVHTFKIRYLNYYEDNNPIEDDNTNDNITENKTSIKRDDKVIIRDEKDKPFAFLGVLSKIIMIFIKFIVFWFAFWIFFASIGLVAGSLISISLIPVNTLFFGSSLSLISASAISILFLLLCIYFIISRKINAKVFIIIFVASIVMCGVGIGISVLSIKNFKVVTNDESLNTLKTYDTHYEEYLVIQGYDSDTYNYVIDSSMNDGDIQVDLLIDDKHQKINHHISHDDSMNVLYVYGSYNGKFNELYKDIINDLKKNTIRSYGIDSSGELTIRANEDTINKLISNLEKLYLIEKKIDGNNIKVITHDSKVFFTYGFDGKYDARNDSLVFDREVDDDYKCNRSIKNTKWGEQIIIDCNYVEDYDE